MVLKFVYGDDETYELYVAGTDDNISNHKALQGLNLPFDIDNWYFNSYDDACYAALMASKYLKTKVKSKE